jgi:hypothetical protein|tara:strand:- start:616 stop:828 length:213 start_codon:yes stop_codon:yes gene_type:complete
MTDLYLNTEECHMDTSIRALMNYMNFLLEEIKVLRARIQPHDTGHIHTTVSVLEGRVKEIQDKIINEKST